MRDESMQQAGTPMWVKIFGLIALVLMLLFAALHLCGVLGGSHHGGTHSPSLEQESVR